MTIAVYFGSMLVAGFIACCLLEYLSKRVRRMRFDAKPSTYRPVVRIKTGATMSHTRVNVKA